MNRRIVLAAGLAAAAGTLVQATAQERRPARIGFVGGGAASDSAAALAGLRDGLRDLGYIEPASLRIDARFAEGDLSRIQSLIEAVEQAGAEVLVAHAQATLPAVRAKRRLPLVFTLSADPVTIGITAELSRPERDATGITLLAAEVNTKRMELLREIAPTLRRVAVLYNPQHGGEQMERQWVDRASAGLGFETAYFPAGNRAALDAAFEAMRAARPEALLLLSDGFMVAQRRDVMAFAGAIGAPVVAGWNVFTEAGALISYGPRLQDVARRPAFYIDRIVRGARPADLPIERPTVLELVVNLNAAQRLGLSLPTAVLARADRVIE